MIPWSSLHATAGLGSGTDASMKQRYNDHANEQNLLPPGLGDRFLLHFKCGRSGTELPFPVKLHYMLEHVDKLGLTSIVSWQCHGRCFVVHKQKPFVDNIMKLCFRQTKFPSFQRQLNLYGFRRITAGKDKGGYYHELFLRQKRFLSYQIDRLKIKGTKVRKASSPNTEPNFYTMPFLPVHTFTSECPAAVLTAQPSDVAVTDPSPTMVSNAGGPKIEGHAKPPSHPQNVDSWVAPVAPTGEKKKIMMTCKINQATAPKRSMPKKEGDSLNGSLATSTNFASPASTNDPCLLHGMIGGTIQAFGNRDNLNAPFDRNACSKTARDAPSDSSEATTLIAPDRPHSPSWFPQGPQNLYANQDFDEFNDVFDSLMKVPPASSPTVTNLAGMPGHLQC